VGGAISGFRQPDRAQEDAPPLDPDEDMPMSGQGGGDLGGRLALCGLSADRINGTDTSRRPLDMQ